MIENKLYRLAWEKLCDETKEFQMKGLPVGFRLQEQMVKAWNEVLNELKEEDGGMTEDSIFNEPLEELVLTTSAWRRLQVMVDELGNDNPLLGCLFFALMEKAKYGDDKELKQDEKKIEEMKEDI